MSENTGQPGRDNLMSRPGCVSENTGQPGRDNLMSRPGCVSENTGHWIVPSRLSRVFSLKTRDNPVPAVCLKIRDIGVSRPIENTGQTSTVPAVACFPVSCMAIKKQNKKIKDFFI